jgi:hypothetical protein
MAENLEAICQASLRCQRILELLRGVAQVDREETNILRIEEAFERVAVLTRKYLFRNGVSLRWETTEKATECSGRQGKLVLCLLGLLLDVCHSMKEQNSSGIFRVSLGKAGNLLWVGGKVVEAEPARSQMLDFDRYRKLCQEVAQSEGWELRLLPQGFRIQLR